MNEQLPDGDVGLEAADSLLQGFVEGHDGVLRSQL